MHAVLLTAVDDRSVREPCASHEPLGDETIDAGLNDVTLGAVTRRQPPRHNPVQRIARMRVRMKVGEDVASWIHAP